MTRPLDPIDRWIVNRLQDGLDLCPRPYDGPAAEAGLTAEELLHRLSRLVSDGVLSRMGPMFNASRMGGELTLCALQVPEDRFEDVAAKVNSFPEVAHNYARDHRFNMWFVLATEDDAAAAGVIARIECLTGLRVLNLPKLEEYFVGMRVDA